MHTIKKLEKSMKEKGNEKKRNNEEEKCYKKIVSKIQNRYSSSNIFHYCMKIFQKPIALSLSLLLILSGCAPFSSSSQKYAPFQQDFDKNEFGSEKDFVMNKLPSGSIFLQANPSEHSYELLEKNAENIMRFLGEKKLVQGAQLAIAKIALTTFVSQAKKIQKVSLLFSATDELNNIDFTELLNVNERTPREQQEMVLNSFSSAVCIAGKVEFSYPEIQPLLTQKVSELKERIADTVPELRYSIEIQDGSLLFTFGSCPQGFLDILIAKHITADFFFAQNKMFGNPEENKKIEEKIEKAIQKMIEMESNYDDENQQFLEEFMISTPKVLYTEFKKMNGVQVVEKTEKSFFSASFIDGQTLGKRLFFVIPSEREREMKKNSLIGSSLQEPIKNFDNIAYSFTSQEKGNELFHSETIVGLNEKSLPHFILKLYFGNEDLTGIYIATMVVGIMATGATALYSGAQKKARAASLKTPPVTPFPIIEE
jgi:hypothetical protein